VAGAVNTAACMRSEPNSQPAIEKIQIASETSTKVSKCNQIHVVTSWILANGIARQIFISHPKPVIDAQTRTKRTTVTRDDCQPNPKNGRMAPNPHPPPTTGHCPNLNSNTVTKLLLPRQTIRRDDWKLQQSRNLWRRTPLAPWVPG
jgi:hypothetical protein